MARRELRSAEAESLVQALMAEGIVTQDAYEFMLYEQNYSDKTWTADEIVDAFMNSGDSYRLRPSQLERFREIAVENGVSETKVSKEPGEVEAEDAELSDTEAARQLVGIPTMEDVGEEIEIWQGRADAAKGFVANLIESSGKWVMDELIDPAGAEERARLGLDESMGIGEGREIYRGYRAEKKVSTAQQRKILQMVEQITGETVETLDWKAEGYKSLNDMLAQKYDLSNQQMAGILQEAFTAGMYERNRNWERAEDIREINEEEQQLLSGDEQLKQRKVFERLNDEFPGRYVFNETNGQIYQVGADGGLVDETGELVNDPEFPLAELPEGLVWEDLTWEEAQKADTPWGQAGTDVDTYYSFMDVIENPDRYHAGGVGRFAAGDPFLGGFDASYGVVQDESEWRAQNSQRIQDELQRGGLRAGMMSQSYADQLAGVGQQVRRPWYDEGDNWALFAGKSPEAIAEVQQQLIDYGALDETDVSRGFWGMAEAKVMQEMMVIANGNALKIEDIDFDDWKTHFQTSSTGAAARRAFVAPTYQKLDPARAQLTIEDAVRRQLGRNATADELADLGVHMQDMHRQSFQADVQAMRQEYDATTRAIDTETAQAGGEVQGVDWEAQFMQKFNERNEAELARFDRTQDRTQRQSIIGGAMDGFMRTLGGGIGGGSLGGR